MRARIFSMGLMLVLLLAFLPSVAEAGSISNDASVLRVEVPEVTRPYREVPIEVFLLDRTGDFLAGTDARVYVWAEEVRDDRSFRSSALANSDSNDVLAFNARDGEVEGEISFIRSGTYKLYASTEYPGASGRPIVFRTEYTLGDALVIGENHSPVDTVTVAYQGLVETGLQDGESAQTAVRLNPGGAGADVTATLFDSKGHRLGAGVPVSASTNSGALVVTPRVAETNANGEVTFRVYGQVTGDFNLYIDIGSRANVVPVLVKSQTVTMQIGSSLMQVDDDVVTLDVAPMIINDRTYVPYRALGEAFGAQVEWYAPLSQVQVFQGKDLVTMLNGSKVYQVNGRVATMDVAPFIHNGRMMVPVRFVAEALGYEVDVTYRPQGGTDKVLFTQ